MVETLCSEAEAAKSVSTGRVSAAQGGTPNREVSVADVTTAGPGLAGRERVRADQAAGAEYRTFPARVPAVLSLIAGAFGVLGALGAGVRASAVETARDEPRQVGVIMGHGDVTGWVLAALAVLVGVAALVWLGRRKVLKLGAAGVTLAFAILTGLRLASFDREAAELADAAQRRPDFAGYHAGLGWGAWLLLAAAIVAAFALLVAVLRSLDLRRGFEV